MAQVTDQEGLGSWHQETAGERVSGEPEALLEEQGTPRREKLAVSLLICHCLEGPSAGFRSSAEMVRAHSHACTVFKTYLVTVPSL